MGKKLEKGKRGEAAQYLTRSNAVRRLQLTLQDFRRLCILKGVYPREPNKKLKGSDKTYFHIKDLKILEHDTLLDKFRDIKTHLKKYKKLQGKKEFKLADNLMQEKPKYTLSHVIRERYPTFQDALRDLDDALCLISLFANFPQHQSLEIESKDILMCQRLYKEWMTYCTIAQCFKKCFYSIKGIYYQVEIMGQQITWIAPYLFNQRLPFDIDYKVIGTFREFYVALMRFVNYKLYQDAEIQYPPEGIQGVSADISDDGDHIYLNSQQIKKYQVQAQKKFEREFNNSIENIGVSEEFKNTPELQKLTKKHEEIQKQRKLFQKCVFLLNREVPIYSLQYLILSFGGIFFTQDEFQNLDDKKQEIKITHQVIDRPLPQSQMNKQNQIEYIQPQYIVDSLNNLILLPTNQYRPGIPPPAHLSPFIDGQKEGYMPQREKEILYIKGEEVIEEEEDVEEEEPQVESKQQLRKEDSKKDDEMKANNKKQKIEKVKGDADSSSDDQESEDDNDIDAQTRAAQKKALNLKLKKDLQKEELELAKTLMSNKQRKLYQKATDEIKIKKDKNVKLRAKRQIIEQQKK